jgi:SAM-dependent methyltransferase
MAFCVVLLAVALIAGALLIYPGELSHVSRASHRWLYDYAADGYERKWRSRAYTDGAHADRIAAHAAVSCRDSGVHRVLDLGCGTGRGVRLAAPALSGDATFVCVDFSARMLDAFRAWLAAGEPSLARRVTLIERSLSAWAESAEPSTERYGLVLLLEVGEFVPELVQVLDRAARLTAARGGLVMTRPAGLWSLAFPGRAQSRRELSRLLESLGYGDISIAPWRSRYELVFARKL